MRPEELKTGEGVVTATSRSPRPGGVVIACRHLCGLTRLRSRPAGVLALADTLKPNSAAAMALSSVSVVTNSLRLRGFRPTPV